MTLQLPRRTQPVVLPGASLMNAHRLLSVSILIALSVLTAKAQIAADLQGRVLDASGAAVPNASVELTESATNVHQQTVTSSSGDYLFSHLNPGAYRIDVTATGFEHLTRSGITVTIGQTVSAGLTLTPGAAQQTVT